MNAEGRYDFWLFDLDGTLVDVDPAYPRSVLDRVGDRLGEQFTDREIELLWYGSGGAREQLLEDYGIARDRFWRAFHETEDPRARAEATFLYDDATRIASLDSAVGLVTHCQPYLTEPVLEALGIRDWFDTVVCCSDEIGWKPDPEPVQTAMRGLGVAHNGHVGVLAGDDPDDIGAAHNAGLDSIHVERNGDGSRERCNRGDYCVTSFEELPMLRR